MIPCISRRAVLVGIGASMCPTAATPCSWQPISAGDAGLAANLGDRIDKAHQSGALSGLHGLVIACRGRLALERYDPGADWSWGRSLGTVAFGPTTLHDLRSVTKSLVGPPLWYCARGRQGPAARRGARRPVPGVSGSRS